MFIKEIADILPILKSLQSNRAYSLTVVLKKIEYTCIVGEVSEA